MWSVSNKDMGGKLVRAPNLEEVSLVITSMMRIKTHVRNDVGKEECEFFFETFS